MTSDISTVASKELLEMRRGPGAKGNRQLIGMVLFSLVFAVVFPYASATQAMGGITVVAMGALVAATWVLTTVPDAFAGERDRKTLETLLATRLPDQAILLGKLVATVVVSSIIGLLALVVAIIASNVGAIVHGDQDGLDIPYLDAALGVGVVLLVTVLLSNVGVLVALRASSALSAQRVMGIGGAALVALTTIGVGALPQGIRTDLSRLADDAGSLPPVVLGLLVLVAFAATNVVLFAATLARFKRPKLVRP